MDSSPATGTVREFCLQLLGSGRLEDKLRRPRGPTGELVRDVGPGPPVRVPEPAREPRLRMVAGSSPLPRPGRLGSEAARVLCLERFAHHELTAVESFAWALLAWPDAPVELRTGWLRTLEDEQRHLQLYLERLASHGAGLGDTPLSDYLWRHVSRLGEATRGPLAFLCAMGLTFEQANLDFAAHYRDAFRARGDERSAAVLQQVQDEEVAHVRLAAVWLRRLKQPALSDVEAYEDAVPFPLGPARAKGRRFDADARRRAGLSEAFIEHVRAARPPHQAASPPPP